MDKRIVITGLGIVSPNGVGLDNFTNALKNGTSGIEYHEALKKLGFSCCIGGIPNVSEELKRNYFTELQLKNFNSSGILYGCMAGVDAWKDAGFSITDNTDYDSGTVFGAGTSGVEKFREAIYKLDDKKVRRLGSTIVAQTMASGVSAYLGGILGLGNQVTTNSSACITGTEAILMGFDRIRSGRAKRMIVGSTSDHGPYLWGGFDALRVLTYKHNESPETGSRPMSASASGFVPGSGAGAMVIESLESALERNATIYAEILGGEVNSGGQRNEGSMTAPNSEAVQRCIKNAIANSNITAK
ncbi:MAG: 3-oxoacyl-[acyl-carrier-protein] synthase-1, partial [Psychroserpens sp.]